MQTCRMCGARLTDDEELRHHNEQVHPNVSGKKGGEAGTKVGPHDMGPKPDPERERPID